MIYLGELVVPDQIRYDDLARIVVPCENSCNQSAAPGSSRTTGMQPGHRWKESLTDELVRANRSGQYRSRRC